MNRYNIHVSDAVTGEALLADLYLLDAEGGSPVLVAGMPSAFQTDANGDYQFDSDQSQLFVKLQSTGYGSKNITLHPGNNNLTMDGISGPSATITASRTFFNKYKVFIFLLLAMVAVFAAIKYKLI